MVKIKQVHLHACENAPDHLLQEIEGLSLKMAEKISDLVIGSSPAIALSALNFMHAAMVIYLVSEDEKELAIAAKSEAIAIMKNIQFLSGKKLKLFEEDK